MISYFLSLYHSVLFNFRSSVVYDSVYKLGEGGGGGGVVALFTFSHNIG